MRGLMKRGDVWYIRYTIPGGKRKWEAIGTSKRQAELVLAKRKTEIKEGQFFSTPKGLKWTYEQLLDRYLDYAKVTKKPHTYVGDLGRIRNLKKAFGALLLKEVTAEKVTVYLENLLHEDYAPATVRHYLVLLKHSFTMAVKWGLLVDNSLKDVRCPVKVSNARLRYLSPEEIDHLLAACHEHLRQIVLTALHTGMRKSNILRLRWEQINLERRFLLLPTTKSGEQHGVPLTDTIVNLLQEIQEEQRSFGLSSPWVFPNPQTGKPYRYDANTAWYNALRKAGITDFHFHDLRHTCASYLAMQGVDLRTIAEILGHKTLAMTMRYAHLSPGHRLAAIGSLEKAYLSLPASPFNLPQALPAPSASLKKKKAA